jgi:RNA polymerase sigma-70 factor (ECF subfamily)
MCVDRNDDDRVLAQAFLSRHDEHAFRELYRRHSSALYRLALRLCGDPSEAEEAVHDGWVRAVRGLLDFRWHSSLRTWLFGIVINRCREGRRRREGVSLVPEPVAAPPDERIDLVRVLAALPDGCREVLLLHDVEGFSHAEIAELLGIAPGTSKSQLFHARRSIRGQLAPTGGTRHG